MYGDEGPRGGRYTARGVTGESTRGRGGGEKRGACNFCHPAGANDVNQVIDHNQGLERRQSPN